MYIAVRSDLTPGLQLAQAVHAAFHFSFDWAAIALAWCRDSNFLVVVSVPDEVALADLAARAVEEGIARTIVREPDLDNSITAVALEPGAVAKRLCAEMPLALKPSSCVEVFVDTDGYNSLRVRSEGVHVT